MNFPAEKNSNAPPVADTEEEILRTAVECIEKYGVVKTSIGDIAQASGFSRPTVYRYFRNKDEILLRIVVRQIRQVNRKVREKASSAADAREKIVEAILVVVRWTCDHRELTVMLDQMNGIEQMLRFRHASDEIQGLLLERWKPLISAAQENNLIRSDIPLAELIDWITLVTIFLSTDVRESNRSDAEVRQMLEKFIIEGLAVR